VVRSSLTGILAAHPFTTSISGDDSLVRRRIHRIASLALSLSLSLVLAERSPAYEDMCTKFLEHFVQISRAMNRSGLWDESDGFFYDRLVGAGGAPLELRYKSIVGVIPALAALAWGEPRRRAYWEQELLNALVIIDRGWSTPEEMRGSWAGAMGHTQWMPEGWLNVGLDYDGDGHVDLYMDRRKIPDRTAAWLGNAVTIGIHAAQFPLRDRVTAFGGVLQRGQGVRRSRGRHGRGHRAAVCAHRG